MIATPLLLALLAAWEDGDPAPRQLTLFVARAARVEQKVSFDVLVELPAMVKSAPAAGSCVTTLTLPGGETPKLSETRTASTATSWTSHFEYTATEAAGPAVWALSLKCDGIDTGATPQRFGVFGAPPNGWMVMTYGSKVEAEATKQNEEFRRHGMRWNDFPRVLDSQWVLGLTPGFFVVVLAVTDDEKMAKTLVRELQSDTEGVGAHTYLKPVWWSGRLDARLLVIEKLEDSGRVIPTEDAEVFMLQSGMKSSDASVRGRSNLFQNGGALLVHSRAREGGAEFELSVGAPQTQCDEKPRNTKFKFTEGRVQRISRYRLACFQGD